MQRSLGVSIDRSMVFPKTFYFLYYAAMAALFPFLTLYYEQVGLSGRQIGLLAGISPLLTLVSAPLWGGLADATRRHRLLLMVSIGITLVLVLALSLTTTFIWLIPVVVAGAFFRAPIMPLVDSTVTAMLGDRKDEYGKQRLWGAVGWGGVAPIAGAMMDRTGLQWAFYGHVILMFGGLLVSSRLPVGHASMGRRFWQGLRSLLANRQWIIFLATILVGGLTLTISISFLFLYLDDLGADKTLMGLSLTVATISELPVWFFSNRLLERWGARRLLAFSVLACATQAFAYSLIQTPWLALPIQLLHGLAFSAMWAAGVSYANEIAPEGMAATAQGLFSGVGMGLRAALGAFVGGMLYENLGAVLMFRWGGVSALLGLFFLAASGRSLQKPKLAEPPR